MNVAKEHIKKNNDSIIRLNVGGMSYCTTYGTLKVSPYFKRLFSNAASGIIILENEEIFIDRDGDLFNHVLEYLRCYHVCADNLEELQDEAEFYELDDMVEYIGGKLYEQVLLKEDREYQILTFEELQKLSSLSCESLNNGINSFNESYELITTLKYKESRWICDEHNRNFNICQRVGYAHCYSTHVETYKASKETNVFLIAKKI